jgi:hypothetical protein
MEQALTFDLIIGIAFGILIIVLIAFWLMLWHISCTLLTPTPTKSLSVA